MRDAYTIALPSGCEVVIVAPTVGDVLVAKRAAGRSSGGSGHIKVSQALLRVLVRKVAGKAFSAADAWPLSARDTMALTRAAASMGSPTEAQAADAKAGTAVATGERETWTVPLPYGRKVELAELPADGVFEAMAAAELEGDRAIAGHYRMLLDGLRRSIVTIDGKPLGSPLAPPDAWPFSPVETELLGAAWIEMHGLAEEATPTMVPTQG